MKSARCKMPQKHTLVNILVVVYWAVSFINILLFFDSGSWGEPIYTLLGNHSLLYPFWGMLIAIDIESRLLFLFFILYWMITVVCFVVSSIIMLRKKKYRVFRILVFSDSIFVILFTLSNMWCGGVVDLHYLMLLGALINLCFWFYLRRL